MQSIPFFSWKKRKKLHFKDLTIHAKNAICQLPYSFNSVINNRVQYQKYFLIKLCESMLLN